MGNKRIMILGATELQIPLIKAAKDMGLYTIVVAPDKREPGFLLADQCEYLDVKDFDGVLAAAKNYQIDGIITDQAESPLRTVAYVAEKMCLSGMGLKTATLFTDKYQQRSRMYNAGIPTAPFKLCFSPDDAVEFLKDIRGDAIIKPPGCQGSKGVYRITDIKSLKSKYAETQRYSTDGTVLIEKFINGKEYVVEGLALCNQFHNLCIGESYYFDIPDAFSLYMRAFAMNNNPDLEKRILERNSQIIRMFGLRQGLTHSEFIVDDHDGEIYLIETAARGGGAFISSGIIPLASGVKSERFLLNIALGKYEMPVITWNNRVCCYIAFVLPPGEIIDITGAEEVKELDYVHHNNIDDFFIGGVIQEITSKAGRGLIVLDADDKEELYRRIDYIRSVLNIQVLGVHGVEGIIWQ